MFDKVKYLLPTDEEQFECANQLLNRLSRMNLFDYEICEEFESALKSNSLWISSDTYLCEDELDGFWRFELIVSKKSVATLQMLPEEIVRYLAQQLLAQTNHIVSKMYTVQELYTKNCDEDTAIFGYLLSRDIQQYSLI